MHDFMVTITIISFLLTIGFILWRPNVNEAIPATIGAVLVFLSGSVTVADLVKITDTISGAAITIMATIVMAIVLESFGFFYWAAEILTRRARGSGYRLFWLTNLFCFLMTLFVNNDGSILITTPILLLLLRNMGLRHSQQIPYLLSGALIATASSAPIGVSNIVNLIALTIVDMDLYMQTAMMLVPASLGLLLLAVLLFYTFHQTIPKKLPAISAWHLHPGSHPLQAAKLEERRSNKYMGYILIFVICVRFSLFAASFFHIPISLVAVIGSVLLLMWRWYHLKISPADMIKRTPWTIFLFAYSMYVIIYGLDNIGMTEVLIAFMEPIIADSMLHASVLTGGMLSVLSNLFNNHPALMIGTITLTSMDLDPLTLKLAYLAGVIGSDVGSLLLPIGTLATLMWMHMIRKGGVKLSWGQYLKVTVFVIPITVIFTLIVLTYWVVWLF
jgi:arsenical pump membrane protein